VVLVESTLENEKSPYFHLKVPNYVYILAISDQGLVPLVQQYRIPLRRNSIELPAGLVEDNQSPRIAAISELREETGISSFGSIIELPPMTLDSGRIENTSFGFLFLGVKAPINTDSAELDTIWVSTAELETLAISGKIDHMGQIALILWASKMGYF
jgi:8-oxo-dGTP pyrophosphatase MutT (NUDIX family)